MSDTNESVCMADIKIGENRTLILTTKKSIELIIKSNELGVDRTFQSSPHQGYQLHFTSREI